MAIVFVQKVEPVGSDLIFTRGNYYTGTPCSTSLTQVSKLG